METYPLVTAFIVLMLTKRVCFAEPLILALIILFCKKVQCRSGKVRTESVGTLSQVVQLAHLSSFLSKTLTVQDIIVADYYLVFIKIPVLLCGFALQCAHGFFLGIFNLVIHRNVVHSVL